MKKKMQEGTKEKRCKYRRGKSKINDKREEKETERIRRIGGKEVTE